jgi:hypothetical protein
VISEATAPEGAAAAPSGKSRLWLIVALVVTFQVLIVMGAVLLFSALGLANDGVGSCGGG